MHSVGCVLSAGVAAGGGVSAQGVSAKGGVCPGGCVSQHTLGQTSHPPVDRYLTHACENITFPELCCGR